MTARLEIQGPTNKFFAVLSTMMISLLAVVAGAALLGMQQLAAYHDTAVPRAFELVASLGLTAVLGAWVLHLGGLVLLLGYPTSEARAWVSCATSLACAMYLLFTLLASLTAFPMCGMRTLM